MSDLAQYTSDEQRRIREAFAAGGAMPACPRCGVAMNERKIISTAPTRSVAPVGSSRSPATR